LNFFDFAWTTALRITKKSYNELKVLLHDDLRYPYLGKDERSYILHLIKPLRLDDSHVVFQGLKFNLQNPTHKKIIWYLFKASVYHLSLHALLSDFSIYSRWARGKQPSLSIFAVSLVEDAIVNKNLKRSFRWMLPEVTYANVISYLRMKNAEELSNDISRVMASVLLDFNVGKVKGTIKDEAITEVKAVTSMLQNIKENPTANEKIDYANKIYDALSLFGKTFEVPSLLYAESHGTNDLFYKERPPKEEEIQALLTETLQNTSSEFKDEQKLKSALQSLDGSDANLALTAWLEREKSQIKILNSYRAVSYTHLTLPTILRV